jgi:hypothetical protein
MGRCFKQTDYQPLLRRDMSISCQGTMTIAARGCDLSHFGESRGMVKILVERLLEAPYD